MKKIISLLLLSLVCFSSCALGKPEEWDHIDTIYGTVIKEGATTTIEYPIPGVDSLDLNKSYQLTYTKGDRMAAIVEVDSRYSDNILIGKNRENPKELIITRKKNSPEADYIEKIEIILPRLSAIDFCEKSSWRGGRLEQTDAFTLQLSAGSTGTVEADLSLKNFNLELHRCSSRLQLSGTAQSAAVDISAEQSLDLSAMPVESLSLSVSSGGYFKGRVLGTESRIEASADSRIDLTQQTGTVYADLSSGVSVDITGNAQLIEAELNL